MVQKQSCIEPTASQILGPTHCFCIDNDNCYAYSKTSISNYSIHAEGSKVENDDGFLKSDVIAAVLVAS